VKTSMRFEDVPAYSGLYDFGDNAQNKTALCLVMIEIIGAGCRFGSGEGPAQESKENEHVPLSRGGITGKDFAALADLVTKHTGHLFLLARHTIEQVHDGYRVDAHARCANQALFRKSAGYKASNVSKMRNEAQRAARDERRTARDKRRGVSGAGGPLGYIDLVETDRSCARPPKRRRAQRLPSRQMIQAASPDMGKSATMHALKIAKGSGDEAPASIFWAALHAREWGTPGHPDSFVQLL